MTVLLIATFVIMHPSDSGNPTSDRTQKQVPEGYIGGEWKKQYLRSVYPHRGIFPSYSDLECLYTKCLPDHEKERLKRIAYTAKLPGPSGFHRSDSVEFSPDPVFQGKWPPCNVPGEFGRRTCSSPELYLKARERGEIEWLKHGTWTGNETNADMLPPEVGQVWQPSFWPRFMVCVNLYPPTRWNAFEDNKGRHGWVEVVHSNLGIESPNPGVWFYVARGSGIRLHVGRTLAALNKIDALFKLGVTPLALAEFILRPYEGNLLTVGYERTGLGGYFSYWGTGGIRRTATLPHHARELAEILHEAAYGTDYVLNRYANTGALDQLMIMLAQKAKYDSIELTVQPNMYTGWAFELVWLRANTIEEMRPLLFASDDVLCDVTKNASCLKCHNIPATKDIY